MKILVCISNVPDTTTKVKFMDNNTKLNEEGLQWIINPWDELALTRAIELKEKSANIDQITVITVGEKKTEPTLRKALAVGADKAVRIDTPAKDAYSVAAELSAYLQQNPYDLILSGIESSDYNGSAVGGMLAEMLDIPHLSSVSSLQISEDQLILEREIEGGKEKFSATPPLLAVVQKGIAIEPKIPAMRGIMMARKKPLEVIPAQNMMPLTQIQSFDVPPEKEACKLYDVDHIDQLIDDLIKEANIL